MNCDYLKVVKIAKIIRLSGTTTIFHLQVPVIKSSDLLVLPLIGTDVGFPLRVPFIGSMLYLELIIRKFNFGVNFFDTVSALFQLDLSHPRVGNNVLYVFLNNMVINEC